MVRRKQCWVGGPKVRKARKSFLNVRTIFLKVILAPFIKKKVQTKKTNRTKVKVKIRGEKERNVQTGLSASESSSEEGHGPGNLMNCVQVSLIPLVQLLNGVARDILHGWRQFPLNLANHPTHVVLDLGCTRSLASRATIRRFQKHALYFGITKEFCLAISPLCLPTLSQRPVWKIASFILHETQ